MREIEFRGKDYDDKWIESDCLVQFTDGPKSLWDIEKGFVKIKPETIRTIYRIKR